MALDSEVNAGGGVSSVPVTTVSLRGGDSASQWWLDLLKMSL